MEANFTSPISTTATEYSKPLLYAAIIQILRLIYTTLIRRYTTQQDLFLLKTLHRSGINPNCNIPHHPLANILTIRRHHRYDRVVSTLKTLREIQVDSTGGPVDLRVRDIRLQRHDLLLEGFVEVQLAGADCVAVGHGAVAAEGPVGVDLDVDVDGSLDVEAWSVSNAPAQGCRKERCMRITRKNGLHLRHAILVRRPHTTQKGSTIRMQIRRAHLIVGNIQLLQKRLKWRVG